MALTEEEREGLRGELARFPGAGAKVVAAALNVDGTALTDTWVDISLEERKIDIHKADLLAMLTDAENGALITFRESGSMAARVFDEFYRASGYFTVTHERMRRMLRSLHADGVIGADSLTSILRLGQRLLSRAEELIGRKIAVAEIDEVLNDD